MTQQDDITQRLRDNADLDEAEHGNARVVQLEREAADEIERLRAELSQVRAPVAGEAQPVADAAIKAAYVEHFGHAAGWLSYKGSWFIEGYRAGRNAAPQVSAEQTQAALQKSFDMGKFYGSLPETDAEDVRNAALEQAAAICDSVDNYANPMTAKDCADAIRALKTQADKDGGQQRARDAGERNGALEQAARLCESLAGGDRDHGEDSSIALRVAAEEIRLLKGRGDR